MRTVTANAQSLLSQNMGTELIVLLEIEWVDGGTLTYSDQVFENALPLILSMGGFDGSMMLDGASDSQSLSVTLDDVDGHLKNIYLSNDIHKRPARIYLQHKSLPSTDKILVFRGELVTPIEWDEATRSLSLTILSKLNSRQVGFSMEEGDFPNIPDEALGQAWPLVFGQVCHLPAVEVRAPRRGYLREGVGIHDFTLGPRICQAVKITCPSQSAGEQTSFLQGPNNKWTVTELNGLAPDPECVNRRFGEICKLKDLLEQQLAYERSTLNVYNGVSFPQGREITLYVDDAEFIGTFTGNLFSIRAQKHPEFDDFDHVACRDIPKFGYGQVATRPVYGGPLSDEDDLKIDMMEKGGYWQPYLGGKGAAWVPEGNYTYFGVSQNTAQAFRSCDEALTTTHGMVGGPKDSWAYYDAMKDSSFFWAPPGTEVFIEEEAEILYIVSLIPGSVDSVAAYRRGIDGFDHLTEVPTDRYTVYTTNYDGYEVVEIGMDKKLSKYKDDDGNSEEWSDQIYVSFTSDIGPNPCDIIEWLVDTYTELSVDATSFADVKVMLQNYPNNFYLLDRPNVYDLIQDIAYQSRCAVYVRNDIVYIKYLSREPDSVRTINESDILAGTFKESLSETEEVYTTHEVKWQKAGAATRSDKEVERKLFLRYNVGKYGSSPQTWDYYTYNIYSLVLKSATFWLMRKANIWRKVSFDLPIKHMDLDVGDCITLDVAQFGTSVKVIVESININPDDNTVSLTCWTPIRAGETEAYFWAWPSLKSQAARWPMPGDTNGGSGYSFTVNPPIGHLLLGGSHRDDQLVLTTGDLHPSDLDDTLPEVLCELSDYVDFGEADPVIEAKEIAQSAARQANENAMTGGGNAGGGSTTHPNPDKCGAAGVGCNYKVNVTWHRSTLQGTAPKCGGPCACGGGCPTCTGPSWVVCHTFGSPTAAKAMTNYMKAQYGKKIGDHWTCNEVGVLYATASNGTYIPMIPGDSKTFASECTDIADPSVGGGGGSDDEPATQTGAPTGATGNEPDLGTGRYANSQDNPYYKVE